MTDDMEFRSDGVCAHDPELTVEDFFFDGLYEAGSDEYKQAVIKARRACMRCPVRDDCLAFAVDHGIRDGFWGGKTAHERKSARYPRKKVNGKWVYLSKMAAEG